METHPGRRACASPDKLGRRQRSYGDVSITKTAYVPATASASTADTVKFTNNDTTAHQVAFKATSGVACLPSLFTLQPGQSGTCTFSAPGTYGFGDPSTTALQGSLSVAEPASPATLSLFARPSDAVYPTKVTLTGELSTHKAGADIVVLAAPCGHSEATKATTMQTTGNGEYTISLRPDRNVVYTVQAGAVRSDPVSIKVRPRVRLGRVGAHRYSLRVFAAVEIRRPRRDTSALQRRARPMDPRETRAPAHELNDILPTGDPLVAFRWNSNTRPGFAPSCPKARRAPATSPASATTSAAERAGSQMRGRPGQRSPTHGQAQLAGDVRLSTRSRRAWSRASRQYGRPRVTAASGSSEPVR